MAGDWIKIEHDLRDKPEVVTITEALHLADRDLVVGKLILLWSWFDKHTSNGCATGVTPAFVNSLVALDGFASALETVGWLSARNGSIEMPKFDRHCSKSAKERALGRKRMQRSRDGASATKTALEKRREESNTPISSFSIPTVEQVAAYCTERGNGINASQFVDYYTSKGWLVGKALMKNWQAAVRNWERNNHKPPPPAPPPPLPEPPKIIARMPPHKWT